MYYYLLYNSSFSFILENRLFTTILYGSILYIITHAIVNNCNIEALSIINNYYWTILSLDIISFVFSLYQSYLNKSDNNLNVSFNLIKNQVNTILDRKNDLTITNTKPETVFHQVRINSPTQQKDTQILSNYSNQNITQQTQQTQNHLNLNEVSYNDFPEIGSLSTPINRLNQQQQQKQSSTSTPISIIREKINVQTPIVNDSNPNYSESVVGSDLGSVMDLDDFEKTL
jgi:hypothetical protein